MLDKQTLEDLLAADCRCEQVILAVPAVVGESDKFKLFRTVLVKETDWHSHDSATPSF